MKKLCSPLLAALLIFAFSAATTPAAQASDWMFRPSYYTHSPAHRVRVGQQPLPRYSYGQQYGAYFRGGYYLSRMNGNNSRNNFPILQSYESWVQGGSQW